MPKVTDDSADYEFGQRFRRAWKNSKWKDYNQVELAKVFDYSKQGMNFIFNGVRYPHLSSGMRISKEFGICMDWLYTGRDPMRPGSHEPYLKIAYKLMPLTETKLKMIDLFVGLVADGRIDTDDMICWLVDQYGAGLFEEREKIRQSQEAAAQAIREGLVAGTV